MGAFRLPVDDLPVAAYFAYGQSVGDRNGEGTEALAAIAVEADRRLGEGMPAPSLTRLEGLDPRCVQRVYVGGDPGIEAGEPVGARQKAPLLGVDASGDYACIMAKRRTQKTEKGLEIPVPSKADFDSAMKKVAPPAGRRRPDGKDRPQKRSS
jgi:hypothetical protein